MARTTDQIQTAIITTIEGTPDLNGLTSPSRRAIWRLFTYVVAYIQSLFEQQTDVFKTEVESVVAVAAPNTAAWVRDRVLKFQYKASDPQVVTLVNLVPTYPVVNTDLRIVTRCSVKSNLSNNVKIKVAKSEPPVALSAPQISALQSYINVIGCAGINYVVSSSTSDKLYINADIYYKGMYSDVISANVIAAIEAYLAALPFDGQLLISDLEVVIRDVTGVSDVVLKNVRARANGTALSGANYLVQDSQLIARFWNTVAGYIVGETTASNTLSDTLTFIPQ
jgi:hypothetical protein